AAALGCDGAHLLVAALAVLLLGRLPERLRRRALAGVGGVLAAALALGAALEQPAPLLVEAGAAPIAPMALVAPEDGGRARAPTRAVEGVDVFLDIGVFETRVEVHARADALERWLGLPRADATLPVAAQQAWLESVRQGVDARVATRLDDAVVQPREVRAGFTTQDAAGVYLRETPVVEVLADAAVGLVLVHPTERIPTRVDVALDGLPAGVVLRGRVLDPEVSRDARLTLEAPRLAWTNALRTDPLPAIEAVAVRRLPIRVPLVSLALVGFGLLLLVVRRRNSVGLRIAALRIALASAALLAGAHAVDLAGVEGGAPVPNAAEQRAIAASLLDNLYRAFNERGEDEVYDRLALSLVGEQLADAYVENRRMLEERRFGGVRTHVDVVALHEWTGSAPEGDGGFRGTATWTVTGTVTHFGHRHWRRNRHEALLAIGPEAGAWKIRVLDVRTVEREK
ncbi:MAG: hypothetical protein P1V36_07110, partial [Planctomycetota bacterium]|nr:hypothetical protein [Planctomycetota bacterium]